MIKTEHETQPIKNPLLFRLTRRCVLFFLLVLLSFVLFYITGNYQQFLDSSQKTIIFVSVIVSLTLAFFSLALVFESIYFAFRVQGKKTVFFLVYAVIMLIIFGFSIALAWFLKLVDILSLGV